MLNYTKTEWQVKNEEHGACDIIAANGQFVARLGKFTIPEYMDNAQLIAAAPDMYEALKLLQSVLTEYHLRDIKKRYSLCVADAAASNALAKAEGK